MAATRQNTIKIQQGDDFALPCTYQDSAGNAIDLTGATVTSQIREGRGNGGGTPPALVVSFTVDPTDLAAGQFSLTLTALQTAALPNGSEADDILESSLGYWDIQYVLSGSTKTIASGEAVLVREVTQ